jgi:4-amino-4-deoxy-L-arabinose transferase-like glycosyltransferase
MARRRSQPRPWSPPCGKPGRRSYADRARRLFFAAKASAATIAPGLLASLDGLLATRRPRLWLVAICLALFLPGLPSIQPLDLGETQVAVATRQMLDSGDLLRVPPILASDPGPIAVHWVQAASVRALEALGLAHRSGIFAYRLPALLGALLAVLATHHWGQVLVGRGAAFLGAAMLAGCAAVLAAAHVATADAVFLAAVTACMGLLATAYLRPAEFSAMRALDFWLCLGAGVLLRGPAAAAVPLLAAAGLYAADRRTAPWLRSLRPGWGAPLLAAMAALPWGIASIATAIQGHAPAPPPLVDRGPESFDSGIAGFFLPGMHALSFPVAAFPAAWIVLLALPGTWRERPEPAPRLLLAWAAAAWVVCEAAAMPPSAAAALPPCALLGARWALNPLRSGPPRWLRLAAAAILTVGAAAIGLGALAVAPLDLRVTPYGLLATAFAALLVWRLLAHGASAAWARAALCGTLLAAPLYAAVLEGTFTHFPIGRVAARIAGTAQRVAPGLPPGRFGVAGFRGASLLFAQGPDVHLLPDGAAAARFLAKAPGRLVAVSDKEERGFHSAAAALGLFVREEAQLQVFDYLRPGFAAMVFFRAEPPSDD